MKLSSKGRYGLLALYDLASRFGDGPVPLKAIALRNEIPEMGREDGRMCPKIKQLCGLYAQTFLTF